MATQRVSGSFGGLWCKFWFEVKLPGALRIDHPQATTVYKAQPSSSGSSSTKATTK
jgi:hypothetical protein